MRGQQYGASLRVTGRCDTKPERAVRTLLHRAGLRYRVDHRVGAGRSAPRPDIVFPRQRVAVFIDGCFWHQCPEHGVIPATNRDFWEQKLRANVQRDRRQTAELEDDGWLVIRAWEHEAPDDTAERIGQAVRARAATRTR